MKGGEEEEKGRKSRGFGMSALKVCDRMGSSLQRHQEQTITLFCPARGIPAHQPLSPWKRAALYNRKSEIETAAFRLILIIMFWI